MKNINIRKIIIIVTLLVGNSVFMAISGPIELYDNFYGAITASLGLFIGSCVYKLVEGGFIIISYAIILFISLKLFPKNTEK